MTLDLFTDALANRARHVCPFLVLGDPSPELSLGLALAAIDAGATMLELGIPYSDPCADGPVIQAACQRAFAAGVSTGGAIEVIAAIHRARPQIPLNLLVYGNLVHARGLDAFCADVARAGAATLLVPDMPFEESAELRDACRAAGIGHVSLIAPTTAAERIVAIDAVTDGYLYLAAHQGVTGAQADRDDYRSRLVQATVKAATRPVALGFGLSRPHELRAAFASGARIAIVGSYLVKTIEVSLAEGRDVVPEFRAACEPLLGAAGGRCAEVGI